MIKLFCDWCEVELVDKAGQGQIPNPFDQNGEICSTCFHLAKTVFSRKNVIKIQVTYQGGRVETINRIIGIRE